MKDISIRIATEEDFETILEVQKNDGYEHSYYLTKKRLAKLFERGELFIIAELGDRPIGMASLDIEIRAKLHFFSVLKTFQKKGVGTKMLNEIIKKLKKAPKKVEVVYFYVEKGAPIVNFLKKNNFKEVGFYKNRYRNGKDAVILEKELDDIPKPL